MQLITQTWGSQSPEASVRPSAQLEGMFSGGSEQMEAVLDCLPVSWEPSSTLSLCLLCPCAGAFNALLFVPTYARTHRRGDKGCPLHTDGERRKTHDSSEKSTIQAGCSFCSVPPRRNGSEPCPSALPPQVRSLPAVTDYPQEPLQLINHLRLVGRTDKNFHFSSLPSRPKRHIGILG